MIWLLVALLLERIGLKIELTQFGAEFSGYGMIDSVLEKKAKAPGAYRVLIPWLIGIAESIWPGLRKSRFPSLYMPMRVGLVAVALWATARNLGTSRALFVAAALGATFLFDYWDWAGELLGLALALGGNWQWAGIGGAIAALCRPETALLVAVTYGLHSGDWVGSGLVGLATAIPILATRLSVGKKPLYCQRWMWRANWVELRQIGKDRPCYLGEMAMTVLLTVLTIAAVVSGRAGPTWPVPIAILVAGWTMARAGETRVFASCLLWISGILSNPVLGGN